MRKDFAGLSHSELEVTDKEKVLEVITALKPASVIHLAAWTDVDGCERNPEKAFLVNEAGTENIALACAKNKARMVYMSTDFVFDGKKRSPYLEDDISNPINVYGASKLAGEKKVMESPGPFYIIRSSWLFGPGGRNFVTKVLELAGKEADLKIVEDQTGSPTYTRDLACAIIKLLDSSRGAGLYHITNSGSASRYEWAKAILKYCGMEDMKVIPIKYTDFREIASRPVYSVLKTGYPDIKLRDWREALKEYIEEIGRA